MQHMARVPCPHCGAMNLAQETVCPICGEPTQAPVPLADTAPEADDVTGVDADVLCPNCRRVMINGTDYDVGANVTGFSPYSYFRSRQDESEEQEDFLVDVIFGWFRKRRLQRALRDYPYSLVCTNCGYILRRRFSS